MNGAEKVAALLMNLGGDVASQVLRTLAPKEVEDVGRAMRRLEAAPPPPGVLAGLLEEVGRALHESDLQPPLPRAFEILAQVLGEEPARRILEGTGPDRGPLHALQGAPAERLHDALRSEHPQAAALVLRSLEPGRAASVLACYGEEERGEIVFRMARLASPAPRALEVVATNLASRLAAPPEGSDPRRTLARVLGCLEPGMREAALGELDRRTPGLGGEVREFLFTFSDLRHLDRRSMQKVLSGVETRVLALALKASEGEVEEHILANVSKRNREMILEERETLGPVPLKEVRGAQKAVADVARDLIGRGEIAPPQAQAEEVV